MQSTDLVIHTERGVIEVVLGTEQEVKDIRREFAEFKQEIRQEFADIHEQLAVQTSRIDMLIYGGGILFTVLCALIAYTSLFAPKYRGHSEKKDGTEKQVQPIVIQLPPCMPAQEVKEKESA